jgi:hypothetical protein
VASGGRSIYLFFLFGILFLKGNVDLFSLLNDSVKKKYVPNISVVGGKALLFSDLKKN